ncbi:MAG: hypothetical protein AAFZ52_03330 [Bacteroidota bacterium]
MYGAFPTDPYSHTPGGKGAQQPGMTGQVKEDILSRFGELGVRVEEGQLAFRPVLLQRAEFRMEPSAFTCVDGYGRERTLALPTNALAFTYCQLPVIYQIGNPSGMEIHRHDRRPETLPLPVLDSETSRAVFARDPALSHLIVRLSPAILK